MPVVGHDDKGCQQYAGARGFVTNRLGCGRCIGSHEQGVTWFQALGDQKRSAAFHATERAQMC
jgi:hypothetical protein